jgi:ArsR family transcriptional regulator
MKLDSAAECLEALGSPHRLSIFRLLVQSGTKGMTVGDVQKQLDVPASTLSHHISKLVNKGLISQERESRNLICCCNYERMNELLDYLSENCCAGNDCCE